MNKQRKVLTTITYNEMGINYQKGQEDMHKAIFKMVDMNSADRMDVFGMVNTYDILTLLSPSEFYAKLTAYEVKKKADSEIKVGDEVESLDTGLAYIIHGIDGKYVEGYNFKSRLTCYRNKNDFKKTGKHFPQVEELLKAIKGGAE